MRLICVLLCATVLSRGCTRNSQPFDLSKATYVGNASCAACHAAELNKWKGSHHDLAMQIASDETVLADFGNAEIVHHGITSRMFRDGQKFMVHTEGPDGTMGDFEVKYVFGVSPLQQYMVEFPTLTSSEEPVASISKSSSQITLPRVQVLRISWDTEKKRWFHLDPPMSKINLIRMTIFIGLQRTALEQHVRGMPQHEL